jgi:hypothetical protein
LNTNAQEALPIKEQLLLLVLQWGG